jgi:uncharacterized membrane protein
MTVSEEREHRRSRFAHRTRHLRQHPRLLIASLAGVVIYLLLPDSFGQGTRLLAAFDLAAIAFLAAIWIMMTRATTADMRRRAQVEDEGRYVVLTLSATVASAILLAITFELHGLRDPTAGSAGGRVALAGLTILLAWFFMNTMFALHYAHFFYGDSDGDGPAESDARGLIFPGGKQPDYWDFLYFSFTIGMTFQVSDVQIESHSLRRTSLAHGVLAFFFNVVVLALTINIVAGLI